MTKTIPKSVSPPAEKPIELSVVTITYNERDNISIFLDTINKMYADHSIYGEVVVVDDSSPDGTADVVLEMTKKYPRTLLIKRPEKLGVGSAYKAGIGAAKGNIIVPLDADLSHTPEVIPQLYALAKEDKIGWGSRYLTNTRFETDFPHRVGTFLLNKWVYYILRTKVKDNSMGYFAMKRETINRLLAYGESFKLYPFDHILYGITLSALARKLDLPVVEVPTTYHRRAHGETKIPFFYGLKTVLGDMWYTLELLYKLKIRS